MDKGKGSDRFREPEMSMMALVTSNDAPKILSDTASLVTKSSIEVFIGRMKV